MTPKIIGAAIAQPHQASSPKGKRSLGGCRETKQAPQLLGNKGVSAAKNSVGGKFSKRATVGAGRRFNVQYNRYISRAVRFCGTPLSASDVVVQIINGDGFYGGLSHCGNVWVCPSCANKVAVMKMEHIKNAVDFHIQNSGRILFLTLTMRHKESDKVEELWEGLSKAYRKAFTGNSHWTGNAHLKTPVIGDRDLGIYGDRRGVEVTFGDNGWHVHQHQVLFVSDDLLENLAAKYGWELPDCLSEELRRKFLLLKYEEVLLGRWKKALRSLGFDCNSHGVDLKEMRGDCLDEQIADYVTKTTYSVAESVALEATQGHNKVPKVKASLTPFGMLKKCVDLKDAGKSFKDSMEWDRWREFSRAAVKFYCFIDNEEESNGWIRLDRDKWKEYVQIDWWDTDQRNVNVQKWKSRSRIQSRWGQRYSTPKNERQRKWNEILESRGEHADSTDEELANIEEKGDILVIIPRKEYMKKFYNYSRYNGELPLAVQVLKIAEQAFLDNDVGILHRFLDDNGIAFMKFNRIYSPPI